MLYPIDLTEAAQTLVARYGAQVAASRRGGPSGGVVPALP